MTPALYLTIISALALLLAFAMRGWGRSIRLNRQILAHNEQLVSEREKWIAELMVEIERVREFTAAKGWMCLEPTALRDALRTHPEARRGQG
jgi:hypothetical protein